MTEKQAAAIVDALTAIRLGLAVLGADLRSIQELDKAIKELIDNG